MSFNDPPEPLDLEAVDAALQCQQRKPTDLSPTLPYSYHRKVFSLLTGENPAIFERVRSWIPMQEYWEMEEAHFADINNLILHYHDCRGKNYKLMDLPSCPPMVALEELFQSEMASIRRFEEAREAHTQTTRSIPKGRHNLETSLESVQPSTATSAKWPAQHTRTSPRLSESVKRIAEKALSAAPRPLRLSDIRLSLTQMKPFRVVKEKRAPKRRQNVTGQPSTRSSVAPGQTKNHRSPISTERTAGGVLRRSARIAIQNIQAFNNK